MSTTTSAGATVDDACELLAGRRLFVLTGAGVSTDSGIPDYRGPGSVPRTPMTYQELLTGRAAQQRYWARAHVGWARMRAAAPNESHHALRAMEVDGRLAGLVTQNVDGLHEAAGHDDLVALHGRIHEVVCLRCDEVTSRRSLHERLTHLNPGWSEQDAAVAPDGDAVLEDTAGFVLADCLRCGGALKPHVVFFGENVPKPRVQRAFDMLEASDAVLVAGSSLQVMSGLRFVRRAAKDGTPVVIVNRGATRGDDLATLHVDAGCSDALTTLATALH
ncbi:NAD-dependent protein deacetylase [Solicola sp. PLA-1-18]|uniref:NAD-dependent protein deacetylase n=1 Tax=Solicola sp. PLA-1-18 TaxID=3380532 RepID=UPI003B7F7613